jgi:iron complex outermembrane receptor protein
MIIKALLVGCCLLPFATLADDATIDLTQMEVIETKITVPPINSDAESKTEFYREELTERGLNRVQDLSKNVPNFSISNQGAGAFRQVFNVRGLVNTAIYGEPAVAFYVDDVAYNSPMTNMGFLFDVDEVSIYRDPQPAQFGKNAYSGAVDIHTRQPTNQLHGGLTFGVASFDNYLVNAKSSGALIKDKLFFNLSGVYQTSTGFLNNNFLHNHPDDQENFSGQAALTWKPTTAWDIRLNLSKDDFNYGSPRFVRVDSPLRYTTNSDVPEQLKQSADSQSLRIAHESDNYKWVSITSRRSWRMSPFLIDLDLTSAPTSSRQFMIHNETWTQEFRLNPKTHGNWDWQIGGFYSNTDYHNAENFTAPKTHDVYANQRNTDNYALLGHLAYQGFAKLTLYQDLRLDYFHSQLHGTLNRLNANYVENRHYDTVFASPKWGLDYHFSDNSLIYASTGLGAKAGGLTYANPDPRFVAFKQENLWHNTVGIKTDWFNKRLTTNLSAFYYQIKNYQIERALANGNYTVFNAPRVTSYGFEVENRAELLENLYLENNIGYTHSRIDELHDLVTGVDYHGNHVPFVPDFNAITALQYKDAQGYFARAEWVWKGKTYFDETQTQTVSQNDYSLLNLRIGLKKNGYSGYLYADNITDNYYYTAIQGVRGVPSNPRMIGAQLGYEF